MSADISGNLASQPTLRKSQSVGPHLVGSFRETQTPEQGIRHDSDLDLFLYVVSLKSVRAT